MLKAFKELVCLITGENRSLSVTDPGSSTECIARPLSSDHRVLPWASAPSATNTTTNLTEHQQQQAPHSPSASAEDLECSMRPVPDSSLQQKMVRQSGRNTNKSVNRYRIPIPLEPLKDGHSMDPKERTFLEAAERGDKHTMIRCLQPPHPVNVNCTNILGRSAIQIAVDNENVEIVELLLQQENVKIGDALLYAIREGVYKIVEMLINHPSITSEMLANDWSKTKQPGEESSDYSPDISPVILAAHCNQFEILQLLLSRGAVIEKPHPLSCGCQKCQEGMHTDSLRYSLRRIHTYRALASPAWISLTSEDPILTAFKLSWELEHLAHRENEFKEIYLELSNQCKKYSCDLLDLCRSTEEVIAVLNKQPDSAEHNDDDDDELDKLTLARLKLALKYEQKQFVAHPNCQQLLTSIWYEGLPVWRRRNGVMKILLCVSLITCMPLIALYYLIFPKSKLGRVIRSPFMKFIYHSASFGFFLVLLVLASTRTEGSERSRQNIRGPPLSFIEWLIFFWVTGMVWSECKQLWDDGLKAYVRQWWNWLDFIMLSLYLATFSLKAVAFFQIQSERYGPRVLERARWPNNDPTLIAEGVFAVANVFSFARIIYLFQTNPHLGPLQISLGCMIIDIAKFLFIFFLVLTSFACGLNQLYWYYDSSTEYCETKVIGGENVTFNCQHNPDAFMTIDSSYTSLLWSLFGVIPIKELSTRRDQAFTKWVGHALLGAYMIMAMTVMINMLIAMMSRSFQDIENTFATLFWALFGISSPKSTELVEDAAFLETVGQGLFMTYHVMSIIVLINMLIAMMTKSFQVIEDHADREWKFARSKLWMGYFDEGSTLPPPFNLIISPKSIYYFFQGTRKLADLLFTQGSALFRRRSFDNGVKEVMKRLVSRYIHQTKKQLRQDGVNEDDLLEIKQDISSLRYELREDRKRESARNTGQLDSIKRDIIRSLRGNCNWSSSASQQQQQQMPASYPQQQQSDIVHGDLGGGILTPQELDALKREVVSTVREEVRAMMRELQQYMRTPHPPPAPPPPPPPPVAVMPTVNSDLYQTHLYTQL